MSDARPKVLIVANIPAPYRVTLFNGLHTNNIVNILVLYCAKTESNRNWNNLNLRHPHVFLDESGITKKAGIKYLNYDIIGYLRRFKPDVIVTGGFFPTMLIAIGYSRLKQIKHIVNTDAWELTEKEYKNYHFLIRKIVYKSTDAFLPVGKKGMGNLVKNYHVSPEKIFIVHYAVDDYLYQHNTGEATKKKYDVMFVGQFIERKMPNFVLEVVKEIKKVKNDLSFLLIGEGPLIEHVLTSLKNNNINYKYTGYLQPECLIHYYKQARVLLFPTRSDGWGVVANEATSLGVPCITNEAAGCAGDLILNDYNGFILDPNPVGWAKRIIQFLDDPFLQQRLSNNSIAHAKFFTPQKAAENFQNAIEFCLSK